MRVFAYLYGIKDSQKVVLNAISLSKIITSADSAYALDPNCKSTSQRDALVSLELRELPFSSGSRRFNQS